MRLSDLNYIFTDGARLTAFLHTLKIAIGFEMRTVLRTFCGLIFVSTLLTLSPSTASAITPCAPQTHGAYTSYLGDQSYSLGGQSQSPEQKLAQADKLAADGKLKSALALATQAYESAQHDPRFVIRYIDSLTAMAKHDG